MDSTKNAAAQAHKIEFTKMHGIGNDYVYLYNNGEAESLNLPSLAQAISHRHCGVGGDGLVVISPLNGPEADFEMRIWNADGSEAQMCGNASRCVGKYLFEKGLTDKTQIRLSTLAGIKILYLNVEAGKVESVRVDMGSPIFEPQLIPAKASEPTAAPEMKGVTIDFEGEKYKFNALSMGNPHAVCFLDGEITDRHIHTVGKYVERASAWPERVNVEFARVLSRSEIQMRVWERGSGETMACGTGSCATGVAAIALGLVDSPVTIHLLGGDLSIEWDKRSDTVFMTGGATIVADGVYYLSSESDNIWLHPRQ